MCTREQNRHFPRKYFSEPIIRSRDFVQAEHQEIYFPGNDVFNVVYVHVLLLNTKIIFLNWVHKYFFWRFACVAFPSSVVFFFKYVDGNGYFATFWPVLDDVYLIYSRLWCFPALCTASCSKQWCVLLFFIHFTVNITITPVLLTGTTIYRHAPVCVLIPWLSNGCRSLDVCIRIVRWHCGCVV